MGFTSQEKTSDNTIESSKINEQPVKSTMLVYEYQGRYGQSWKEDEIKTQQQMQTKLLSEKDKIYHDSESNKLILDNLKPIPTEKQKVGGADHTLDGYGVFQGIYGEKTNEEITRKKVARLVSPDKFAEIEQMPVKQRNAEVQKITHGRSLINTPVNVGFHGTEHIKPTSHKELKGYSNLSALKVKTGQLRNEAFISPQRKQQEQADISLTYNSKLIIKNLMKSLALI